MASYGVATNLIMIRFWMPNREEACMKNKREERHDMKGGREVCYGFSSFLSYQQPKVGY